MHKTYERLIIFIKNCLLFIYFIYFSIVHTKNAIEIIISLLTLNKNKIKLKSGLVINNSAKNTRTALVYREIFLQQVYNYYSLAIKEDDIVIDIGADIGIFSLFASTKTKGKIFTYEPSAKSYKLLQKNIESNTIKNIYSFNMAVNATGKPVNYYQCSISQMGSIYPLPFSDKDATVKIVRSTTLEKIIKTNHIRSVGFLKIDCEGAEGEIIGSTPKYIFKKIDKIALEFHDRVSILNHEQIQKKLQNEGYIVKSRWNRGSPFGYIYAYR